MKGKLIIETVSSQVLKGNPLGDPHLREVPVYLPPSYGKVRGKRFPVIYELPGFTGTGRGAVNYNPWKANAVERLDRLIAAGARECLMVIPDAFTAYGGSQYINSSATGRYEDYIITELVPYLEDKFAAGGSAGARAVMGGSSGGYGALVLGMRHPDVFAHVASHSGDSAFESSYGPDIPKVVTALGKFGGSLDRFRREFLKSREKWTFDHSCINMVGMASCYSPNPKSPMGFDLPFDEYTGELIPKVWARWLELDPVMMAPRYRANLKKLKTLYFDCGTKDEFNLHLGARRLARTLKGLSIKHIHEEGVWGHMDRSPRLDRSLKLLTSRLS
jgi:enterochelin esterase family protein